VLRALGNGFVVQELQLGSADVSVESPDFGVEASASPTRFNWKGISGRLALDRDPSGMVLASLRWNRAGTPLQLSLIGDGVDEARVRAVAELIQFEGTGTCSPVPLSPASSDASHGCP
jgi:hypothetical protein